MTVMYGEFELPTEIKVDEKDKSDTFARFVAEPFERGFGHTIGNALRRIMLNSMESPAIVSVKIEGVPHEYMAIEGVIEDMTHIVLNLKSALLRKLPIEGEGTIKRAVTVTKDLEVTQEMLTANGGQYLVTLKDILGDCNYDIVNPNLKIFSATMPMKKRIALKIAIGRGYLAAERQEIENKVVDEIVLDSAFSPVRLVNYYVENTRVGQDTDYDRLVLEVKTDGRITPHEALTFATQIGIHHFKVFDEIKLHNVSFDKEEKSSDSDKDVILSKLALKINEIELSVRSTNCLSQASIETIAELVVMPESDMLRFRNFGKKSLNEIKAKLEEMGLYLGMDLSRYGINKDNVREVVQNYLNEKLGRES